MWTCQLSLRMGGQEVCSASSQTCQHWSRLWGQSVVLPQLPRGRKSCRDDLTSMTYCTKLHKYNVRINITESMAYLFPCCFSFRLKCHWEESLIEISQYASSGQPMEWKLLSCRLCAFYQPKYVLERYYPCLESRVKSAVYLLFIQSRSWRVEHGGQHKAINLSSFDGQSYKIPSQNYYDENKSFQNQLSNSFKVRM